MVLKQSGKDREMSATPATIAKPSIKLMTLAL
jgi:hypothetical protein